LLVSSAKASYDTERTEVIQMAAKIAFLDRLLTAYGPEAADARAQVRANVADGIQRMWPHEPGLPASLAPNAQSGKMAYAAIEALLPNNDMQRSLKTQTATLMSDLGQIRSLLIAQSVPSISTPMLMVLVSWLVIIFLGFSALAPPNATAAVALMLSAFAVSGAIFLILELDQPFGGLIRISSEPMLNALSQFTN